LLVNAAMHTPAGTAIEVTVSSESRVIVFNVADRGPGIPSEALLRVFDKFYRAPDAPAGGSGLGLTIAKGFVEAHSGTLEVANREGGGSVFTVRLPQPDLPALAEAANP
jgi:two-component system sensor histidine kinase KdpD